MPVSNTSAVLQKTQSLDSPLMQYVGNEGGQRFQAYGRVTSAAPVLSGQLKAGAGGKQLAAAIDRSVTGHGSGSGPLGHRKGIRLDRPKSPNFTCSLVIVK